MGREAGRGTIVVTGFACALGVACGPAPRNPEEFRQLVRKGGWGMQIEEKSIARDWQAAFADVTQNAERCFNVSTKTVHGSYGQSVEFVYLARSRRGEHAGEVSVQMDSPNFVGEFPEGGMYILVADLGGQPGTTRITVYRTGKPQLTASVIAWAEGKGGGCPDMR